MKWLFCILALYITLLPALPCRDSNDGCRDEIALNNQHNRQEDHKEKETCSPFCACTCCQVSNNVVTITAFTSVLPVPRQVTFRWPAQEGNTSDRTSAIWQPPRLG